MDAREVGEVALATPRGDREPRAVFKALDKDGNGKLTPSELSLRLSDFGLDDSLIGEPTQLEPAGERGGVSEACVLVGGGAAARSNCCCPPRCHAWADRRHAEQKRCSTGWTPTTTGRSR